MEQFRNRPMAMFEIATGEGGSCRIWRRYFGLLRRIVTIDLADTEECQEHQIFVRTGDRADPEFLRSLVKEVGAPDIVPGRRIRRG